MRGQEDVGVNNANDCVPVLVGRVAANARPVTAKHLEKRHAVLVGDAHGPEVVGDAAIKPLSECL